MFSSLLKNRRSSTVFRLTVVYTLLFVATSLILFGLGYIQLLLTITNKDHQIVSEKIKSYTTIAEGSGIASLVEELKRTQAQNERTGFFVRVAEPQGKVLSLTLPQGWNPMPPQLSRQPLPFVEGEWVTLKHPQVTRALSPRDSLVIAGRLLRDGTILQVGYSTHVRRVYLESYQGIFLFIIGPIILFGIMVGTFVARRALKPVHDLTLATKSVRSGRMDARVPLGETDDELRELAQQFNAMLDWIATLMNGMREALDNVAHDLRTPLTRMRASIEAAMQAEADTDRLREALLDCAEESQQIMNMLTTLMDISEAETGVMQLNVKPVNVGDLIASIYDLYLYSAEEKGLTLETTVPPDLRVDADAGRLRQALSNLVDNAVKYTPEGGRIMVEAWDDADTVRITVRDSGPGIPETEIPRIFDRLYRGDKSRSQRGLGLGLCLVKAIAEAHGGTIEVWNAPEGGAVFTFSLPRELRAKE
ncbi:MAG TPA: HAMP domain-containing sensor histidine kinase [Deltaproteobacteria bacterium]|nr:HAMP domain-containing sensor histidine kinase [Deltaproteobacteria bacterium]